MEIPKLLCMFCVILCGSTFEVAAKGATCDIGMKIVPYLNFPIRAYACIIKSFDLNGNDTQMVIKGTHQADKSDDDVKTVNCWNCTAPVSVFDINFCTKFKNLEQIQLAMLEMEQVNPKAFKNCQNLMYLHLDSNKIREIRENLLSEVPKLIVLSLNENQISSIDANAFKHQKQIRFVFLNGNQLKSLPPKVFEPLINLEYLWLQKNQLTTIHSDSFGIHRHLTFVSFLDNKIDAIDEKFIENTAVNALEMHGNICYGDGDGDDHDDDYDEDGNIYERDEMKEKLQKCFDNYQPRPLSRISILDAISTATQSTRMSSLTRK